jgi:Protein of unknown function (DUF4240)
MRLSTLVAAVVLGLGATYVAHNAGAWLTDVRDAKTQLAGAVRDRVAADEIRLRTRLEGERARAAAARRAAEREAAAARKAAERQAATAGKAPERQATPTVPAAHATVPPTPTTTTTPTAAAPAATQTTAAAPADLTEGDFWRLIAETRSAAGNDTAEQSQLLEQRLTQLSPQAIVDFAQIRRGLDERAYTWDLWGAADVIEDGCSDDCFRHFRGYVISLGQEAYENALRDPDSLATVVQDDQTADWESADDVAPQAYAATTGSQLPVSEFDPAGDPPGTPFDENDQAALAARYPQLTAHFR